MTGYQRVDLGVRGRDYLLQSLSDGGDLSEAALPHVASTAGDVFAYLPSDPAARQKALDDFRWGANMSWGASLAHLVAVILEVTAQRPAALLIEDDVLSGSDPVAQQCTDLLVLENDKVIHRPALEVRGPWRKLGTIVESIVSGSGWKVACFLCGDPGSITKADLSAWVQHLYLVATSAWDADGYIIWVAHNLPPKDPALGGFRDGAGNLWVPRI
jgi:hypothetical protein